VKNVELTGLERLLKNSEIISTRTDPRGLITFVNTMFTNITSYQLTRQGLKKEELKQQVAQLYKTVRKAELAKPRNEQIKAGLNCLQKELKKLGYSDYQDFAKLAL